MEQADEMLAAVKAGDLAKVQALVEAEPSLVNATVEPVSAVLVAVYWGQPAIADFLIEHGADLNLWEATATNRRERVAQWLVAQPDLVNAFAPDGFTALTLAAFFGHLELAGELLAQGADVNLPVNNEQRVQPLHSAVASGQLEIARILLEHGADVNARQQQDFTPLMAAAQNGQVEMIDLLLAHGAERQLINSEGRPAMQIAVEADQNEAYLRLIPPNLPTQ